MARKTVPLVLATLALASAKRTPMAPRGTKLVFQWKDMHTCPETKDMNGSAVFRYLKSGDVFADSQFSVVKPAKTISKMHQTMTSCREDGTECEHFMNWVSGDGCSFIAARNAVWSPAFANIRPPFLCPIAATHYTNNNWTMDKDLLNLMPFPRNRQYVDRLEFWNEKDELFWCWEFTAIWKLLKQRN